MANTSPIWHAAVAQVRASKIGASIELYESFILPTIPAKFSVGNTVALEFTEFDLDTLGLVEDAVYEGLKTLNLPSPSGIIVDLLEAWKTKGKKLSAAHKKAISDALKKRNAGKAKPVPYSVAKKAILAHHAKADALGPSALLPHKKQALAAKKAAMPGTGEMKAKYPKGSKVVGPDGQVHTVHGHTKGYVYVNKPGEKSKLLKFDKIKPVDGEPAAGSAPGWSKFAKALGADSAQPSGGNKASYSHLMTEDEAKAWSKDSVVQHEVYHFTPAAAHEAIMKVGLKPGTDKGFVTSGGGTFFTVSSDPHQSDKGLASLDPGAKMVKARLNLKSHEIHVEDNSDYHAQGLAVLKLHQDYKAKYGVAAGTNSALPGLYEGLGIKAVHTKYGDGTPDTFRVMDMGAVAVIKSPGGEQLGTKSSIAAKKAAMPGTAEMKAAHPLGSKVVGADGKEYTVTGHTKGYVNVGEPGGPNKYLKHDKIQPVTKPVDGSTNKAEGKDGGLISVGDVVHYHNGDKFKVLGVSKDGALHIKGEDGVEHEHQNPASFTLAHPDTVVAAKKASLHKLADGGGITATDSGGYKVVLLPSEVGNLKKVVDAPAAPAPKVKPKGDLGTTVEGHEITRGQTLYHHATGDVVKVLGKSKFGGITVKGQIYGMTSSLPLSHVAKEYSSTPPVYTPQTFSAPDKPKKVGGPVYPGHVTIGEQIKPAGAKGNKGELEVKVVNPDGSVAVVGSAKADFMTAGKVHTIKAADLGGYQYTWVSSTSAAGAPASTPVQGSLPHASDLTIQHGLGGSTGAKLAQAADGSQYVVKYGASKAHAAAEAGANDVYAAAGVTIPKHHLDKDGAHVAEYLKDARPLAHVSEAEADHARKQLAKHFVLDAVLGNRDVVGPDNMNVLIKDGVAYRVDNGASFDFRAQGGKKDYGPGVVELKSLRDANINPTTAKVYEHLTSKDVLDQATELHANKAKILAAASEQYREVLGKRIDDALAQAQVTHGIKPVDQALDSVTIGGKVADSGPAQVASIKVPLPGVKDKNGVQVHVGDKVVTGYGVEFQTLGLDPVNGKIKFLVTKADPSGSNNFTLGQEVSLTSMSMSTKIVVPGNYISAGVQHLNSPHGQTQSANPVKALHATKEIAAAHPVGSQIHLKDGSVITVTGHTTGYVYAEGGKAKMYKVANLAAQGAIYGQGSPHHSSSGLPASPTTSGPVKTAKPSGPTPEQVAANPWKGQTPTGNQGVSWQAKQALTAPLVQVFGKGAQVNGWGSVVVTEPDAQPPKNGKVKQAHDHLTSTGWSYVGKGPQGFVYGHPVNGSMTVSVGGKVNLNTSKVPTLTLKGQTLTDASGSPLKTKDGVELKAGDAVVNSYGGKYTVVGQSPSGGVLVKSSSGQVYENSASWASTTAKSAAGYAGSQGIGLGTTTAPKAKSQNGVELQAGDEFTDTYGTAYKVKQVHSDGSTTLTMANGGEVKANPADFDVTKTVSAAAFSSPTSAVDSTPVYTGGTHAPDKAPGTPPVGIPHAYVPDGDSSPASKVLSPSTSAVGDQVQVFGTHAWVKQYNSDGSMVVTLKDGSTVDVPAGQVGTSVQAVGKGDKITAAFASVPSAPGVEAGSSKKYDQAHPPVVGQAVYDPAAKKNAIVTAVNAKDGLVGLTYGDGSTHSKPLSVAAASGDTSLKPYDPAKSGATTPIGTSSSNKGETPFSKKEGWPTDWVHGETTKHDPQWVSKQNSFIASLPPIHLCRQFLRVCR